MNTIQKHGLNLVEKCKKWIKPVSNSAYSMESSQADSLSLKGQFTEFQVSLMLREVAMKIIASFNLTDADLDQIEAVVEKHGCHYSALLDMIDKDQDIPAKFWLIILFGALVNWEKASSTIIDDHFILFECDTSLAQGKEKTTIETLFELLILLKQMEKKNNRVDDAHLIKLAQLADRVASYFPEQAHDLYNASFNWLSQLPESDNETTMSAQELLSSATRYHAIAWKGNKKMQVAVSSVVLAEAYALCAKEDFVYRKKALLAIEQACERLDWTPAPLPDVLAQRLQTTLRDQHYLKTAGRKLFTFLGPEYIDKLKKEASLRRIVPVIDEPATEEKDLAEWIGDIKPLAALDATLDDDLFEHMHRKTEYQYSFNISSDWRINHASYLNAIPQNKSFFREKNYKINLTALIHEVTHLLSLRGGVGLAVIILRSALVLSETRLLAQQSQGESQTDVDENSLLLAQLKSHCLKLLPDVAAQLALANKIQALYRTWMPILEGIAMFAELDADPLGDKDSTATVHLIMVGLTDQFKSDYAPTNIEESYLEFLLDYEQKASQAIQDCRGDSLRVGLEHSSEAYWAGYLTVRSIVRRWRDTMNNQPAPTSAKALKLLMLAVTHGTMKFVPPLDMAPEDFETACEKLMQAWCKSVATLDKASIEIGTSTAALGTTGEPIWHTDTSLCSTVTASTPEKYRELQQHIDLYEENLIDQALKPIKLNNGSIEDRVSIDKDVSLLLDEAIEKRYLTDITDNRKHMRAIVLNQMQQLLQLEIGSTSSRFYLKPITGTDGGYLYVNLRTTEMHIDTEDSSYNGFAFPLQKEEFQAITSLYEKYREPRIMIRRFVDILETVAPRGFYPHLLVFSYGHGDDMTHIVRGACEVANAYLESSPEGAKALAGIIGCKITPNKLTSIDLGLANGNFVGKRSFEWLQGSHDWAIDGFDISTDVELIISQLKEMAEELTNVQSRVDKDNAIARRLAEKSIGLPDQGPAQSLNSFRRAMGLTTIYTTARTIIETGNAPNSEKDLVDLQNHLFNIQAQVFSPTTKGIDIVPFEPIETVI